MNVVIYSHVSSQSARQSAERQVIDLKRFAEGREYKVAAVFEEKISGRKSNVDRPVLSCCLEILKALDILHIHKVCVYIQNLNLEILRPDKTVNPLSSLVTTLLGELVAMERQGIIDRLNSGRELYIEKGGRLGRRPGSKKSLEQKRVEYKEAISLLKKGYSIRNVVKLTGKSVSTIQTIKREFLK